MALYHTFQVTHRCNHTSLKRSRSDFAYYDQLKAERVLCAACFEQETCTGCGQSRAQLRSDPDPYRYRYTTTPSGERLCGQCVRALKGVPLTTTVAVQEER